MNKKRKENVEAFNIYLKTTHINNYSMNREQIMLDISQMEKKVG